MVEKRMPRFAWIAAIAVVGVLAGCASEPTDTGPSLQGTWLVTTDSGDPSYFGTTGLLTLAFSGATSGTTELLGERPPGDVRVCGTLLFALAGGELVLTSPAFGVATFDATFVDDDRVTLTSSDVGLTLDRLAGTSPVAPCGAAVVSVEATLPFFAPSSGTLASFGSTLYLNLDTTDSDIVGYDLTTQSIVSQRAYTQVVHGGRHHHILAAASHDVFYGQCFCGGSTTFDVFDLSTNTSLATFDSEVAMAGSTSLRFGDREGPTLVIGGRERFGDGRYRLATLDPDTLAVIDEITLLEGSNVVDVALMDGTVYALVRVRGGPSIVEVADDGSAVATYPLPHLLGLGAIGVAASDGTLYVAASDLISITTVLFAVELQ